MGRSKQWLFLGMVLSAPVLLPTFRAAKADDWPQWRGPGRDGVWRETGIIKEFAQSQVEVLWRQPISGGYSGPTVSDGQVYVSDRVTAPKQMERVHCFDARTGRHIWTYGYDCIYSVIAHPEARAVAHCRST